MKTFSIIGKVLLLLLLLFLSVQSINTMPVYAYEGGTAVFCPNLFIPEPDGPDTADELWLSYQTCDSIHDMMSNYGDNDLNYFKYNESVGEYTWGAYLSTLKSSTDHAAVFSKGHCVPWGDDNIWPDGAGDHWKLLEYAEDWEDADGATDSDHILPYTEGNENYFVFIWHCGTALSYPSNEDNDGWYGMPYAFTRNNAMGYYGDDGNYVYLGWSWQSPQFESQINWQYPDLNWTYAQYAYLIFDYLCDGYSVDESLYYVSEYIGDVSFWESGENGELIVWGNGDLGLPD